MTAKAVKLITIAIFAVALASVGFTATSALADEASRKEIRRQQEIIRQQQLVIHRLETRDQPRYQASPVTGEPVDTRRLPKGLLNGILPDCPLGFAYNPFVGCVLYVAH